MTQDDLARLEATLHQKAKREKPPVGNPCYVPQERESGSVGIELSLKTLKVAVPPDSSRTSDEKCQKRRERFCFRSKLSINFIYQDAPIERQS